MFDFEIQRTIGRDREAGLHRSARPRRRWPWPAGDDLGRRRHLRRPPSTGECSGGADGGQPLPA